jgi:AcrR family transcriptional regulator
MTQPPAQKERIQQAALKVFSEKGYGGATIAEIAACAGVNPATIYTFFKGKQELFQSLRRPDLDFPDLQEQQRREEILHAALKVFAQQGYAAASMDDIAAAAGLSKAGVYFYFSSKETLFSAAMENPAGFSAVSSAMSEFLSGGGDSLEEGLVRLSRAYLSLFTSEDFTALLKAVLSEGMRNPGVAAIFKEKIVKRGSELAAGYLKSFCPLEPEALAGKIQALFGMLFSWGLINRLFASQSQTQQFDLDQVAREYVHLFLYGVMPGKE